MESDPPIATATIARIYMKQGMLDEAEALYRRLLQEQPNDARLMMGLAEVERRRAQKDLCPTDCQVALEVGEDRLECRWRISDEGRRRAGLVLGADGRLTLRLVTFPVDARRPHQDIQVEMTQGQIGLKPPSSRSQLLAAAVGLMGENERFVAIAHAEAVALQSGPPSAASPEPERPAEV